MSKFVQELSKTFETEVCLYCSTIFALNEDHYKDLCAAEAEAVTA